MATAQCPYCQQELPKKPQRKSKCKFCKQFIYVKSTPTNREKRLMTEDQAKAADAEWSNYHQGRENVNILQAIGLTEADLQRAKKGVFSKKTDQQALWALLEKTAKKSPSLQQKKMAYYYMALISEKEGKEFHVYLTEAIRCELLRYKQSKIQDVKILTAGHGNACPTCEQQEGKVYSIKDALKQMPIPCKDCTTTLTGEKIGFCRCSYIAVVK